MLYNLGYVPSTINVEDKYFIKEVLEQAEILIKYDGYIKRQKEQVNSADKLEKIKIPEDFDYSPLKTNFNRNKRNFNKNSP